MPLYEFECMDCGRSFESLIRSKDQSVSCPECSSRNISKLFSTFACPSSGRIETSGSSCSTCAGGDCSQCF